VVRASVTIVTYREYPPPRPLAGLVECGWVATVGTREPVRVQQVLPDSCMDLIWSGGELLVAGPDTVAHPVHVAPGTVTAGLRFAAGALPSLLGVPAAELRDRRVRLADLHPRLARAGADRLAHADIGPGPAGAPGTRGPALLGEIALGLPAGGDRPPTAVLARIAAGAGVAATAHALGCTTRTLHRRCLDHFGYGPAVLRRVLRFRRAVALLHAGLAPAAVAAESGYADQPHLSREVRALAGVAPGQLASGANRSTPVPSGSRTVA
jgi:AraC-like DNA-binding protein